LFGGLSDEIRVSVLLIISGEGTLFFGHIEQEQPLRLKDLPAYKNGMVKPRYEL
jgi:dihydrofolate reductase